MPKFKRQHIFLAIFMVIILIIVFVLVKNMKLFVPGGSAELGPGIIKPAYLSQPVPKINKLKTVVDNPKFKEMKYIKSFFAPVIVEEKGRSNPFMPFVRVEEE
ncbi:hypothetical protein ISS21_02355 [Patescibacteria group bacterium]|nr:hypothetical protein [Patescibacteria group bacterium]